MDKSVKRFLNMSPGYLVVHLQILQCHTAHVPYVALHAMDRIRASVVIKTIMQHTAPESRSQTCMITSILSLLLQRLFPCKKESLTGKKGIWMLIAGLSYSKNMHGVLQPPQGPLCFWNATLNGWDSGIVPNMFSGFEWKEQKINKNTFPTPTSMFYSLMGPIISWEIII